MWQTWKCVCWFVVRLWGQAHTRTSSRLVVAANLPVSSRRHAKPRCGFASRPDVNFSFCVTASWSQNGLYSRRNRRISDLSIPKCFKWNPAWGCTVCGDCSVLLNLSFFWRFSSLFSRLTASQQVTDGLAGGGWKATKETMLKSLRRLTERTDKARDCYSSYSHLITLYVANWGVLCVTAGVLCALGRSGFNRHKRELALFLCPPFIGRTRVFFFSECFFFLREDLANAACMLNPPHPLFLAPSYPSPPWFYWQDRVLTRPPV